MPKLRSIVPLTPAEAEVKNIITKKELQALVIVANCHLYNLGVDVEYTNVGRVNIQRARTGHTQDRADDSGDGMMNPITGLLPAERRLLRKELIGPRIPPPDQEKQG